jgi:hypothetical protein
LSSRGCAQDDEGCADDIQAAEWALLLTTGGPAKAYAAATVMASDAIDRDDH